ncbi:MAG: VanZ family protein [Flavobacteriales bacterium]
MQQLIKSLLVNTIQKIGFPFVFVIITLGSLLPSEEIPKEIEVISDKWIHFCMYLGFNISFFYYWIQKQTSKRNSAILIYSTGISIFYGILMEVLQYYFVPGRYGDILDVIANTIGASLAWLLLYFLGKGKN